MDDKHVPAGRNRPLAWALARLREPSTWAGLAIIAAVLGSEPMQGEQAAQVISLILGGGLVASGRKSDGKSGGDEQP